MGSRFGSKRQGISDGLGTMLGAKVCPFLRDVGHASRYPLTDPDHWGQRLLKCVRRERLGRSGSAWARAFSGWPGCCSRTRWAPPGAPSGAPGPCAIPPASRPTAPSARPCASCVRRTRTPRRRSAEGSLTPSSPCTYIAPACRCSARHRARRHNRTFGSHLMHRGGAQPCLHIVPICRPWPSCTPNPANCPIGAEAPSLRPPTRPRHASVITLVPH